MNLLIIQVSQAACVFLFIYKKFEVAKNAQNACNVQKNIKYQNVIYTIITNIENNFLSSSFFLNFF